jgi:hypothetical protein
LCLVASNKQQATSNKQQATSNKQEARSKKQEARSKHNSAMACLQILSISIFYFSHS